MRGKLRDKRTTSRRDFKRDAFERRRPTAKRDTRSSNNWRFQNLEDNDYDLELDQVEENADTSTQQ